MQIASPCQQPFKVDSISLSPCIKPAILFVNHLMLQLARLVLRPNLRRQRLLD